MNKKKIFVFAIILLICPTILLVKDKLNSKDDIYVLTEESTVSDENKNNDKKEKIEDEKENISYIFTSIKLNIFRRENIVI